MLSEYQQRVIGPKEVERTLFFYILSLAGLCSFGDCLAEEGKKFANTKIVHQYVSDQTKMAHRGRT